MSRKKHHHRSHRREREREHERARAPEPARGLLARVVDRVRAWFGDHDAIRRLRREAGRMSDAVREKTGAVLRGGAVQATPASDRPRRRRRRFVRESYPMGFVPAPQAWPWRFIGHGVPWAPGPESYYPQFIGPAARGRPIGGPPRGRFAGRGPRNYRRSDDRIIEEIHEILTYSPQIDASNIEVRVTQGDVTVLGSVDDRYTKRLVEDLIHDVPGVRDLQNRLRIERRELHGAGGRAEAGGEHLRVRRDITAGRDLDDLESSNLNVGDERCQREEERGTSSSPG